MKGLYFENEIEKERLTFSGIRSGKRPNSKLTKIYAVVCLVVGIALGVLYTRYDKSNTGKTDLAVGTGTGGCSRVGSAAEDDTEFNWDKVSHPSIQSSHQQHQLLC